VESEELLVTERLDVNLFVTTSDERAQFVAQHFGVASCDDNFCIGFCMEASNAALKFLNVLNFINKDVVFLPFLIMVLYVSMWRREQSMVTMM
jgi:hypothetical protein